MTLGHKIYDLGLKFYDIINSHKCYVLSKKIFDLMVIKLLTKVTFILTSVRSTFHENKGIREKHYIQQNHLQILNI